MSALISPTDLWQETEVLCFTSTHASPGLRLPLRRAFRSGNAISAVRGGRQLSIRVVDYVENPVEDGVSVVATISMEKPGDPGRRSAAA
jgi:hypothetical protein